MIGVALIGVGGQYFPMWGGMFFPARKNATEEDYYFAEYSAAERERGLHLASSAFVSSPYGSYHLFVIKCRCLFVSDHFLSFNVQPASSITCLCALPISVFAQFGN